MRFSARAAAFVEQALGPGPGLRGSLVDWRLRPVTPVWQAPGILWLCASLLSNHPSCHSSAPALRCCFLAGTTWSGNRKAQSRDTRSSRELRKRCTTAPHPWPLHTFASTDEHPQVQRETDLPAGGQKQQGELQRTHFDLPHLATSLQSDSPSRLQDTGHVPSEIVPKAAWPQLLTDF